MDFCYWNLTNFVQSKNPNVPDVAGKLIKPVNRTSLLQQRKYWDIVFEYQNSMNCIYNDVLLTKNSFDLDHFIPWSFVSHDLQWNLVPSDKSINSSKSNKLPSINYFMKKFAEQQKLGLSIVYHHQPHNKKLEDFTILGCNASELDSMDIMNFTELYRKTLTPIIQIAENLGFEKWNLK